MADSIDPGALAHPLEFPPEFKQWLADYVALQVPKFPISQVFGFQLQRVRTATVDTEQSTASTSYTDLATAGPTLSNLANGFYIIIFGADMQTTGGSAANVLMSPAINGATPSDNDSSQAKTAFPNETSYMRIIMVHLDTPGGLNEIIMKYRTTTGTASYGFRFLHALKVLTLDE